MFVSSHPKCKIVFGLARCSYHPIPSVKLYLSSSTTPIPADVVGVIDVIIEPEVMAAGGADVRIEVRNTTPDETLKFGLSGVLEVLTDEQWVTTNRAFVMCQQETGGRCELGGEYEPLHVPLIGYESRPQTTVGSFELHIDLAPGTYRLRLGRSEAGLAYGSFEVTAG